MCGARPVDAGSVGTQGSVKPSVLRNVTPHIIQVYKATKMLSRAKWNGEHINMAYCTTAHKGYEMCPKPPTRTSHTV
eukprot:COSAG01_NODE_2615_length_7380_cov_4.124159_7_plen_77_part_00